MPGAVASACFGDGAVQFRDSIVVPIERRLSLGHKLGIVWVIAQSQVSESHPAGDTRGEQPGNANELAAIGRDQSQRCAGCPGLWLQAKPSAGGQQLSQSILIALIANRCEYLLFA